MNSTEEKILSKYNFYLSDKNNTLIYNARTGSLVKLSNIEYDQLINNSLDSKAKQILFSLGIIIDHDFNEYAFILKRINENLDINLPPLFRILPTTRCNARCFYCYEQGISQEDMTLETIQQTVSFIKNKTKDDETFYINWFGGEPLHL